VSGQSPFGLRVAVAALAVAFAACIAGLVLLHNDPTSLESLRNSAGTTGTGDTAGGGGTAGGGTARTHRARGGAAGGSGASGSSGPTSLPTVVVPTTVASGGSSGGPAISALHPTSGAAGTKVTISGRSFFSVDGQILVYFGSVQAPTSCPTSAVCIATAPPGPRGTVQVSVHTQSGVSNGQPFSYSTR
jgi:hypothetical protein